MNALPITQSARYAKKAAPKLAGTRKQRVGLAAASTKVHTAVEKNGGAVAEVLKYREQMSPAEARILYNLAHQQQMKELRTKFRTEYISKKTEEDKRSVERFNRFRQKVLQYRELKRRVTLKNIYRHQEMSEILSDERERFFREKYQRRLNIEASKHSRIQAALRAMSKESEYYITPENLDRHIERELNPARVLVGPTIFGPDKYGVNDEVALHAMKYQQYQNRMSLEEDKEVVEQERKKQMFRIDDKTGLESSFGTESDPVPSSVFVNPVLYDNKYIRDFLYPYIRVLRDDVVMRKEYYEANKGMFEADEDFDEGELFTIDLNDPETMELLEEMATEENIPLEELLDDVREAQEEDAENANEKIKNEDDEDPQELALEMKEFEEFERARRNPNPRADPEFIRRVLDNEPVPPTSGRKPEFYNRWLKSFPALSNVLAGFVSNNLTDSGHSAENTLASIATAMQQNEQVRNEFNSFLAQFLPTEEVKRTADIEATEDEKVDPIQERVDRVHNKLRLKFGDDLFNAVTTGPSGAQLKDKLTKVREYLISEGFPTETANVWATVIESRILNKQMKIKKQQQEKKE